MTHGRLNIKPLDLTANNMTPQPTKSTDEQLKRALAKMLPDYLTATANGTLYLTSELKSGQLNEVKDTELLDLCWRVEDKVEIGHDGSDADEYQQCLWYIVNPNVPFTEHEMMDVLYLHRLLHATWQQRCEALATVLDIEL